MMYTGSSTMDFPRAPLPRMARVRQELPDEHLPDVAGAVRDALARGGLRERIRPGQRVAITAGVRKMPEPIVMPITRPMEDQKPSRRTSFVSVPASRGLRVISVL